MLRRVFSPRLLSSLSSRNGARVAARLGNNTFRAAAVAHTPSGPHSSPLQAHWARVRSMTTAKDMMCFQCEQTENGTGCEVVGVCGKTPEVAWAQDLFVEQLKRISAYAAAARNVGGTVPHEVGKFTLGGMFSTLTNVNFDFERFRTYLKRGAELEAVAREAYLQANGGTDSVNAAANIDLSGDIVEQAKEYGVEARRARIGNDDVAAVAELCTYGMKGLCAYAEHASQLGFESDDVISFVHETLDALRKAEHGNASLEEMLGLAMSIGAKNAEVMALLDQGHNSRFGTPSPTQVRTTPVSGKCILVSGHDLGDLEALLKQTEGTGINVYTHGEMLPAHGYPELRKYKHLVGNYGGAWQLQNFDFAMFPGPVLVTTNCIIEPRKSYKDRIFTTNAVGFDGVKHVEHQQFGELIERAKECEGFEEDEVEKYITVGFGHKAILDNAEKIIELVKGGKISHFFFIGGCDGSQGERSYFTKVAKATPKDSLILTAGCGKYRFNHLNLGELADTGIPRVLDLGQCNDSYGAVKVAMALAGAFDTDVNGLPLSLAVSWFEQKAVAVLLTLLHFNVRNIRLGPALPAFLTPNVLEVLVDKFALRAIGDPKEDVKAMLENR